MAKFFLHGVEDNSFAKGIFGDSHAFEPQGAKDLLQNDDAARDDIGPVWVESPDFGEILCRENLLDEGVKFLSLEGEVVDV